MFKKSEAERTEAMQKQFADITFSKIARDRKDSDNLDSIVNIARW